MTTLTLEKYQTELEGLTTNAFEKELLSASLKILLDKDNKLRFNNFACGIRELSRHILSSLAPDEEVEKCCWYKNESKKIGKATRAERVKYAIQKGLPDNFVETFYDTEEHQYSVREAIDILNKYTHVNADTFDIPENKIAELASEVLDAFTDFVNGINECYRLLKDELDKHIDNALVEHTINETFDEVDILSTHHNIEETHTTSIKIIDISSTSILVEADGYIEVRHQFGSDGDFAKGDGFEMNSSFPFDCNLEIKINEDFAKSEYLMDKFKINTDEWYE